MPKSMVYFVAILLSPALPFVISTISPGDKAKHASQLKIKKGPQDDSVFDRGLVEEEPTARDILIHNAAYYKETTLRRFNRTTLGYVTAWNSHGYDVAKTFAKKFDIISPVWLQIIRNDGSYELSGTHDIDTGWMRDLQRKGKRENGTVKIFPRVMLDKFTQRDISNLLSYEKERIKINQILTDACKKYGFDGIVLELWAQLAGRVDDQFLYTFVLDMVKALKAGGFHLILVIPPLHKRAPLLFGEKHLDNLYKHVYAFSLMTYDFSTLQRPGANSPLYWVRESIEQIAPADCHDVSAKRAKILMGLNMYGNDYTPDGGGPIIGNQYLELVKHVKKRLAFDEHDVENFFEIRTNVGRHYVFYPSLYSINERIKLAEELGVGISIWELGQGLDYFYDLF